MNVKKIRSPITGREYEIRKLPPIYLARFTKLSEADADESWVQVVNFLKASIVNPKLTSEEDVLNLGEDADFLLLEAAAFNKPSEEYRLLFRGKASAEDSGGGG